MYVDLMCAWLLTCLAPGFKLVLCLDVDLRNAFTFTYMCLDVDMSGAWMWTCLVPECGHVWCLDVDMSGAWMWTCLVPGCEHAWCLDVDLFVHEFLPSSSNTTWKISSSAMNDDGVACVCSALHMLHRIQQEMFRAVWSAMQCTVLHFTALYDAAGASSSIKLIGWH